MSNELNKRAEEAYNNAEELLIITEYHAGLKTLQESQERLKQYVNKRIEKALNNKETKAD